MKQTIVAIALGISLTVSSVALLPSPAHAVTAESQTEFQKAVDLYDLGRYREAYDIWLKLARDNNDPDAMRNVAQILRLGLGVEQQLDQAFLWYSRAAEAGLASAQVVTAIMLLRGEGTTKDQEQAAKWFKLAAEQDDTTAQYNLALMYEHGLGIRQDVAIAQSWYEKAADSGHAGASKRLAVVKNKLEKQLVNVDVSESMDTKDVETNSRWSAPSNADDTAVEPTETKEAMVAEVVAPKVTPEAEDPFVAIQKKESTTQAFKMEPSKAKQPEAVTIETADVPEVTKPRTAMKPEPAKTKPAGDKSMTIKMAKEPEAEAKKPEPVKVTMVEPKERKVSTRPRPVATAQAPKAEMVEQPKPKAVQRPRKTVTKTESMRMATVKPKAKDQTTVRSIVEKTRTALSPTARNLIEAETLYRTGKYAEARNIWTSLAESNVPEAQFWLGRLYNRGEGVSLDRQKAYTLWKKASDNGHNPATTALVNLISRFGQIEGAPEDRKDAALTP